MPAKKKNSHFNLATLNTLTKSVDGVDLQMKSPRDGGPIGDKGFHLIVTVFGPESAQYKKAQHVMMKSLVSKENVDKNVTSISDIADNDYEALALKMISDCIKDWKNLYFNPAGEATKTDLLDCTDKNKELVLTQCPWFRRQLQDFIGQERNFMMG